VIDVGHVGGIRRLPAEAEVPRRHDQPVGGQRSSQVGILGAIAVVPRAAMDLDQRREWTRAVWAIHACKKTRAVLQVLPLDLEPGPDIDRWLRHTRAPSGERTKAGMTSRANRSTDWSTCSTGRLPNAKQPIT